MAKTNTEKIDIILEIVQTIKERNARRDVQIDAMLEAVKEHDLAIYGNGKPGIKTKIESLEHNQRIVTWVGGIMGGAVLAEFASKIIALLK